MDQGLAAIVSGVITAVGSIAAVLITARSTRKEIQKVSRETEVNTVVLSRLDADSAANSVKENFESTDGRSDILKAWLPIRSSILQLVADERDGRIRRKYDNIDKRSIYTLIESLDADEKLGDDGDRYRRAAAIYMRYRPNRTKPTKADIDEISALSAAIDGVKSS